MRTRGDTASGSTAGPAPPVPPCDSPPPHAAPAAPLARVLHGASHDNRTSMLVGLAGISTYFLCVWLTREAFGFDLLPYFAPLIGAMLVVHVAEHLALAGTHRWWQTLAAVFGSLQELMLTAVLWSLGGLRMSFLVFVYAFPIFHTAMLGSDTAVLVAANVGALSYGVLAWLEVNGTLPPPVPLAGPTPTAEEQAAAYALITWAALNFFGLYASRYGHQLRNLASYLQDMVRERTAELTKVNAELATKAQALEEKQDEVRTFVYAVTHDLKNPVNNLLLSADLLYEREGARLSAVGREELGRIVSLADGTEGRIRSLLELFRITSDVEPAAWVDLRALVDRGLETLAPQIAAKRIDVRVGALPRVIGQPGKLAHVLANLLSNAVKYVPDAGGRIDVSGSREGGRALIVVRDNGIGIPAAYHRSIFELFVRVPASEQCVNGRSVPGTGLGLALVKRIVEAHGGSVLVESEPGAGAAFHVSLPGYATDEEPAP